MYCLRSVRTLINADSAKRILFLKRRSIVESLARRSYIRGIWPEPITQTTLNQFLKDTNYFEEPKNLVNIGLDEDKLISQSKPGNKSNADKHADQTFNRSHLVSKIETEEELEKVLDLLAQDKKVPELRDSDVILDNNQLMNQAFEQGIYRDLFTQYKPSKEHVKFTQDQAERMNRLVPYYWITDQPFARVDQNPKKPEPFPFFNPVVRVDSLFIDNDATDSDERDVLIGHRSYCGNFISAQNALKKPAISLDGGMLNESQSNSESKPIWESGNITLDNFPKDNAFYTVVFLNLDYLDESHSNLHWMVANLSSTNEKYEEVCEYLPVHALNGFGYSRYVFLALRHEDKIDVNKFRPTDFSPESRKFNPMEFITSHKAISMKPVGLSWFQTSWDISSNKVFHDYLNMKSPKYEHVFATNTRREEKGYPGRIPFNIYLDHVRDEKETDKIVLLERLRNINPTTGYENQYVPPRVPETIFEPEEKHPDWMHVVNFKKSNKLSYWRGLRPASATIPLENNADLDHPIRPLRSSMKHPPGLPNLYPGKKMPQKCTIRSDKADNEFHSAFIADGHEVHADEAKKLSGPK